MKKLLILSFTMLTLLTPTYASTFNISIKKISNNLYKNLSGANSMFDEDWLDSGMFNSNPFDNVMPNRPRNNLNRNDLSGGFLIQTQGCFEGTSAYRQPAILQYNPNSSNNVLYFHESGQGCRVVGVYK